MNDHGIGSWPARRARMAPHRRALVQDGVTVTYGELHLLVNRAAHGLRAAGVRRGDRVAFLGLNSVELVVTMFATARLGAVFLPLNTRLAPPELAFILEDCEPTLLVWAAGFEEVVKSPAVSGLGIDERRIEVSAGQGLAALLADDVSPLDEPVGLDDLFMVQYTSGTSGRPKGVMLTHGNITWNVYNLLVDVDLHSDEVALVTAPLFHTAALNQVLLPTMLKGGVALVEAKFDPERVLRLVETERVTLLFGVTSMYLALAQQPGWETVDLSSLRSALSGGAPIPAALLQTWRDRGVGIIQGYGLTEASPGTTMLRASDGPAKLGSAGTACFFTDVRLAGPALEEVVPPGSAGEILVSGPNVSPGYWRNEQATRSARVAENWLRTGDLGVVDEDGFLYVVDRVKDMIISGGENIYPAEVEQALYTHPDVAEAAVIGVPDDRWGEVGRAVVVLRPGAGLTADALLTHLEGRLARYKIPKSVVFVEELPHNASGKLVKAKVRELHGAPAEGVVNP